MSEEKSLIPFDEYYTVLKAAVKDENVQAKILTYDELNDRYYAEGGDPLSDAREESSEVYDAFHAIGFAIDKISVEHGWTDRMNMGQSNLFDTFVYKISKGGWPQIYPGPLDIEDKAVIRDFLWFIKKEKKFEYVQINFGDDA